MDSSNEITKVGAVLVFTVALILALILCEILTHFFGALGIFFALIIGLLITYILSLI